MITKALVNAILMETVTPMAYLIRQARAPAGGPQRARRSNKIGQGERLVVYGRASGDLVKLRRERKGGERKKEVKFRSSFSLVH